MAASSMCTLVGVAPGVPGWRAIHTGLNLIAADHTIVALQPLLWMTAVVQPAAFVQHSLTGSSAVAWVAIAPSCAARSAVAPGQEKC